MVNPLIDATEMYLRTVYELEEEGITPIRARLVERLNLSAPAVSETVARLQAEGLMRIDPDRRLELTDEGRAVAISVMRKHRLSEKLLTDVIGLPWEDVHVEACRWEHVISDAVEERLVALLDSPDTDPHGNPIPGIATEGRNGITPLTSAAGSAPAEVVLKRISEKLQGDVEAMRELRQAGIVPGATLAVRHVPGGIAVTADSEVELDAASAALLYVATD